MFTKLGNKTCCFSFHVFRVVRGQIAMFTIPSIQAHSDNGGHR